VPKKVVNQRAESSAARPGVRITLREQNKIDKFARIRAAATELFSTKGFDNTSMREIADHARVGLATLFLYATDKRDLLFLACNDDLEELTRVAFAKLDSSASLRQQLIRSFRYFFEHYASNPQLSRDLLRELTFYTSGRHAERFQATRRATIGKIAELIENACAKGRIATHEDPQLVGEAVFYIFAAEVRRWLSGDTLDVERGVQHLGKLLNVLISGLSPR
jgi:AcrR family transcriptional regulator